MRGINLWTGSSKVGGSGQRGMQRGVELGGRVRVSNPVEGEVGEIRGVNFTLEDKGW